VHHQGVGKGQHQAGVHPLGVGRGQHLAYPAAGACHLGADMAVHWGQARLRYMRQMHGMSSGWAFDRLGAGGCAAAGLTEGHSQLTRSACKGGEGVTVQLSS
jgi:hypothetical protein